MLTYVFLKSWPAGVFSNLEYREAVTLISKNNPGKIIDIAADA